MSWKQLLVKLDDLHKARETMNSASIYQGMYENIAIELNGQLRAACGLNYIHFSQEAIEVARFEVARGLEESESKEDV